MSEDGDTATTEQQDDRQRSSPGSVLREARENRGWTTREVANNLHLTMHYVNALESDEFDKLPGDVFVRGYMRSYALLLELDPDEVVQRYRAYSERRQARKEEAFKRYNRRRSDKNRPWVIISGIAFVGLAILLWYLSDQGETPEEASASGPAAGVSQTGSESGAGDSAGDGAGDTDGATGAGPGDSSAAGEAVETAPALSDAVDSQAPAADRTLAWGGADTLSLFLESGGRVEVNETGGGARGDEQLAAGEVLRVEGTAPFDVVIHQASGATLQFNDRTIDIRGSVREDGSARLTIGM